MNGTYYMAMLTSLYGVVDILSTVVKKIIVHQVIKCDLNYTILSSLGKVLKSDICYKSKCSTCVAGLYVE